MVDRLGAHMVVPSGEPMSSAVRRAIPEGVDAVVYTALLGTTALSAVRDEGSVIAVREWPYAYAHTRLVSGGVRGRLVLTFA